MKKTMIVKLEKRENRFFPIGAFWTQNKVKYCAVYETAEQARHDFIYRYYPLKIRFIEKL